MKFEEALKAMREGKIVRRKEWDKTVSITYNPELKTISKHLTERRDYGNEFEINNRDFTAEDWEIYGEKEWHRTTAECTVKGAKEDDTLTFSSKKTCAYAVEKYDLYINIPGFMLDLTDREIKITIETID